MVVVAVSGDLGNDGGSRQRITVGDDVGDDVGNDVGDRDDGGNNAGNDASKRDGRYSQSGPQGGSVANLLEELCLKDQSELSA